MWSGMRTNNLLPHPYAKDAAPGTYDAIIVDSSDPVGPASVGEVRVKTRSTPWLERRLVSNG